MMPGSIRLAGLSIAAAGFIAGAACREGESAAPPAAAASPMAVSVAQPRRGIISRQLTLPATVRARDQAVLYAKVAGYLKTIRVDKGDRVKAGQVVAEIEAPELAADYVRQKAEVAVAEVAHRRVSDAQKKAPDLVMPQTVDDAKGKLDMAQANLTRTETLLGYTRIIAPFSGIISRRSVDPGAFIPAATSGSVATSAALLTLIDIRSVRIEIPVPEPEVPRVKVGLPVQVTVDELPGRVFTGAVTRFAYALDEASKTMLAEAEIPNPTEELRPGMYARVRVGIERKVEALLVPAAAVIAGRGQDSVLTIADGKAKRLPVKTGFRDDSDVEILDGLSPDQPVILGGSNPPADGQPVQIGGTPR
jgi:membrane fusion protein (multidrug efflux system)